MFTFQSEIKSLQLRLLLMVCNCVQFVLWAIWVVLRKTTYGIVQRYRHSGVVYSHLTTFICSTANLQHSGVPEILYGGTWQRPWSNSTNL